MRARPLIGVLVGSDSDRMIADAVQSILDDLSIPHEILVASAHRDPDKVRSYSKGAERRGIRVLIGIAGLAAALPGVMSSHTKLPVIGIPVATGPLQGIDALLSIAQLPSGVPAATMGLGSSGAKNGALLAARILALQDDGLRKRLSRYRPGKKPRKAV